VEGCGMSLKQKLIKDSLVDDIKIILFFLVVFLLLISTPPSMFELINQSALFKYICHLNPFVLRMGTSGNQPDFALYCYGVSFILSPYFLYIVFNSKIVRASVEKRYLMGGKAALRNSALVAAIVFILVFFYFGDFSPERTSRIDRAMFYSHTGIAFWSICVSFFLMVMLTCFLLYASEFFKKEI
jgi:hypothetical protein